MASKYGVGKDIRTLEAVQPNIPENVGTGKGKKLIGTLAADSYKPLGSANTADLLVPEQQLQDATAREEAGLFETATAAVAPTARDWGNAIYESYKFTPDVLYRPDADAQEFFNEYQITNQDEVAYINAANSYEDMEFRKRRILDRRDDQQKIADNPITGVVASMFDIDAAAMLVPAVGEVAGAAKLGRIAQRTANAAIGAGGAYAINSALEDKSTRTQTERDLDSLTFGLVGFMSPIKYKPKELDAAITKEMADIAAQNTAKADEIGSVGTTNLFNHQMKVPISQPIDTSKLMVPDWAKSNKTVAALQSSADYMYHITHGDMDNVVNKILAAPRTQGDNVPYATAPVQALLEAKLTSVEQAIEKAAIALKETSPNRGFGRKKHTQAQYEVGEQFGQAMQRLDQTVVDRLDAGLKVTKEDIAALIDEQAIPNEIKDIQRAYVNSGFAEEALSRAKQVGLLENLDDAAALHSRSTYMPVKHSWERMNNLMKSGVTREEIATFIGKQIKQMYPDFDKALAKSQKAKFVLTEKQLGLNFIENQEKLALGLSEVQTAGLTKDQMITLLRKSGVDDENLNRIADVIYKGTQDAGTGVAKPFRKRMRWDFNAVGESASGRQFTMGDLVDGNAYMNLTDYTRTMSKRIGLAQYGIKTTNDLDQALAETMKNLPKNVSVEEARRFLQNVRAQALGHPMGEAVPETVRSLNTIAGATFLSNSGLYNTVDLVTQVAKMGLLRTLPEIKKGFSNLINPMKKMTKGEATDLYDVLTGMLSTDGRWRNITTRYADDFEVTSGIHEGIQYYGQSTRFLNLSEYAKRFQIGLIGGTFVNAFKNAAKGSAKDIAWLRNDMKFSDELVKGVQEQYKLHGGTIDLWDNNIRMAMEQKVFYEADNLAHTIRGGEIPAFMEHSSVGKIIFPFMSFAFAMQQKVLRNTYQRDGGAGIAMLAAVQLPAAVLVGMAKNVKNGKEPDEDLAKNSVNALSMLGSFSYPLEIIINGGLNSSSATLAPIANAATLGKKAAEGTLDMRSIKGATPLGSFTGLDLFITAIEE